jgi:short subunit dehydrogenase-like uncharacterized protein
MGNPSAIILYGSYGYTGRLIAAECRAKGLNVILAGRNEKALQAQSEETGYPFKDADVDDAAALRDLFKQGNVVIHCAGPFQFTSKTVVEMCLQTRTHYTDITGEYQVFEMLAGYDEKAKAAGITILPGAGFDVVPSDCLALHLKNRLPSATHLQLAFSMSKGGLSRGTSKTMIEGLGQGSVIRKDGKLTDIPLGKKVMEIDFNGYKTKALNIPWGDVSTAWTSTHIPNIEVYMAANAKIIVGARISGYFNWLLKKQQIKKWLLAKIDNRQSGPSAQRRIEGKSFLWGKASDEKGNERITTIETMSGYRLTAMTSVLIAEKIMNGDYKTGYQTPATAYGPDLIMQLSETVRIDR